MSDAFERAVERERQQRRGRHRARSRACLRAHAQIYLAVNLALVAIWALGIGEAGRQEPWFLYSVIGWGGGLLGHYLAARPSLRRPAPAN